MASKFEDQLRQYRKLREEYNNSDTGTTNSLSEAETQKKDKEREAFHELGRLKYKLERGVLHEYLQQDIVARLWPRPHFDLTTIRDSEDKLRDCHPYWILRICASGKKTWNDRFIHTTDGGTTFCLGGFHYSPAQGGGGWEASYGTSLSDHKYTEQEIIDQVSQILVWAVVELEEKQKNSLIGRLTSWLDPK